MKIKHNKGTEYDIVQIVSALLNTEDEFCLVFIKSCNECPIRQVRCISDMHMWWNPKKNLKHAW